MNRLFHGGNLTSASLLYKIKIDRFIDFSANINPLGMSPEVKNALLKSIDFVPYYPEPYCERLKTEIANYLGINKENILVGNGSCDLIYLTVRSFKPKNVLIPVPTFSEYEYAVKINGGRCHFLRLSKNNKFLWEPESIVEHLNGIDMIFICNPNNPTGSLIAKEALLSIVTICKKNNVKIVIDEAFIDFVENHESFSMVRDATFIENLIVLRSLTKFFGLAGLRVGYLTGKSQLIKKIALQQIPWAVNALGQIAAKEALKDKKFIKETRNYIQQERRYLWNKLKAIEGIEPYPATANFILCHLSKEDMNSSFITEKLGYQGILIRDCKNFRGLNNKFIRIAVKKREENLKLISALNKILPT